MEGTDPHGVHQFISTLQFEGKRWWLFPIKKACNTRLTEEARHLPKYTRSQTRINSARSMHKQQNDDTAHIITYTNFVFHKQVTVGNKEGNKVGIYMCAALKHAWYMMFYIY